VFEKGAGYVGQE